LSVYAALWIAQNQRLAANAGAVLAAYKQRLGFDTGFQAQNVVVGYMSTIAMLAVASALAVIVMTAQWKP
jgi:MFS superfamily sulfate permease-like transporter